MTLQTLTQRQVNVPLTLTPEMMRAVRCHATTESESQEAWYARLGWLICAWPVLLEARPKGAEIVEVPAAALEWLIGEVGEFEPSDAHLPQSTSFPRLEFWRSDEFKRRVGL